VIRTGLDDDAAITPGVCHSSPLSGPRWPMQERPNCA
jgi:hypothetical protein